VNATHKHKGTQLERHNLSQLLTTFSAADGILGRSPSDTINPSSLDVFSIASAAFYPHKIQNCLVDISSLHFPNHHHQPLPTTTSHELEYFRCLNPHFRILLLPRSLQEAGLRAALNAKIFVSQSKVESIRCPHYQPLMITSPGAAAYLYFYNSSTYT
jgi:hypothetical protein